VFTTEPLDSESPYWDMPTSSSRHIRQVPCRINWTPLVDLFAENLRRFESGRPLLNVVDKALGY